MKIVTDIPEEQYHIFCNSRPDNYKKAEWYILHGTPIEDGRPTLIYKGQVVYLTDEHIQAMAEWDKRRIESEVIENLFKDSDQESLTYEDIVKLETGIADAIDLKGIKLNIGKEADNEKG